jgi:signal transduction histidine kinase
LEFQDRLPLYGLLLLAAALLYLSRAFLLLRGHGWGWGLLAAAWAAALLGIETGLLVAPNIQSFSGLAITPQELLFDGLTLGWGFLMFGAVLLTWLQYRRTHYPPARNRIKYWLPVLGLACLGDGLVLAGLWPVGAAVRLASTLAAAYPILARRLPALRNVVLRGLSTLVTTSLAVVLYAIFLAFTVIVFTLLPITQPWLVAVLLSIPLVVVLIPVLNAIQKRIRHLLVGDSLDPRAIVREYSQSVSNILDLRLLAEVVVGVIREGIGVTHGYLFTVEREKGLDGKAGYTLKGVHGKEESGPEPTWLPEDGLLAGYFSQQAQPLTQYDLASQSQFFALAAEERAWLSSLAADIYVPIYKKGEWLGMLALGAKLSGEPYLDDDKELLSTLADQTAVALENARLVESLMRLNADFRRANVALDQANRRLERLDRTKSDFISVASHELRTPLTVLTGYSQMLLEDPALRGNPDYARLLSGIQSGASRLHEILESLLDMAEIETQELHLNPEAVVLPALIRQAAGKLEKNFNERSQTLEIQDLSELPQVEVDYKAMLKVFNHLLVNAIKYTPDGGKITISGQRLPPNPDGLTAGGVELVVSDTGIGIDPAAHELIFVKFYHTEEVSLHSSGKTKFKGSGAGLGLTIARGIVQAHGGKIWVESQGHDESTYPGSQFHIVLPLRQTTVKVNPLGINA